LESRSNFKTLPFSATLCQSFSFTYSIGFMRFDLESEKNGRSIVSFWSRKVGPDRHSGDRRGTPVGCETAPKGTHPGLRLSEAQFAIEGAALRLSEGNTHSYRRFFLDGRTQKAALDVEPETYTGISVGKWDGEALVVDTVGFNDKTWLDPTGKPHSEDATGLGSPECSDHDRRREGLDQAVYVQPGLHSRAWLGIAGIRLPGNLGRC
jgi:hypothetical protein